MLAYYLHDLNPLIFRLWDDVGPRWYGMAYVLAFICGYVLLRVLAKLGYADLSPVKVGDFITGCALFGVIVGGRLGYVFFYKPEMLREPLSILRVWQGGMSSHGGMIGLLAFTFYPEGIARSSNRSGPRGRRLRADRSFAHHAGSDRRCGPSTITSGGALAFHFDTAPSIAAL